MTNFKLTKRNCIVISLFALGAFLLTISPLTLAQEGFLTFTQAVTDDVDDADGLNGVASIAMSPDSKHIYVASVGDFSIALFNRNTSSGNLAFVDLWRDGVGGVEGLDGAWFVTVSPDGNNVYVASVNDSAIAVFKRDTTDGRLTFTEAVDLGELGWDEIIYVIVSPDGKDVYAAFYGAPEVSSGIVRLRRNLANGSLTVKEKYQDGVEVGNLDGVTALAISPDGKNIYATAPSALTVFSRNLNDGELTVVETEIHRFGANDGLVYPTSVGVSPDGKNVYIVDKSSYSVAAYTRHTSTGEIDFLEVESHDVNGVTDMISPYFVAISPDGLNVFVVNDSQHAVVVFERNPENGRLDFIESVDRFDVEDSSWMLDPRTSVISPDGAYLYLGAYDGNSIVTFKTTRTPDTSPFQINAGLNGAWYYPQTNGQGFLIDVFPVSKLMFVAWFTYDTEHPDESVTVNLGHPSQRWLTAQGTYFGRQAVLDVYSYGDGLFDTSPPAPTSEKDGTLTIEFSDCNTGTVTYDLWSVGRKGLIPIERPVTENVPLCESLNEMAR